MTKKANNKYFLDFMEFEERVRNIAEKIKSNDNIKDIFGIPRGGLIPAIRLSHLTGLPITPNPKSDTTAIIDDCIDSGATKHSFSKFEHFYVLIDKKYEKIKEWIIFWWENK